MMKIKLFLIITFLLIIPFSFANELKVLINEEEIPSLIELKPKDSINIKLIIPKDTSVEKITINNNIKSYEAIIDKYLDENLKFEKQEEEYFKEKTIIVPKWIPNGEPILNIEITYETNGDIKNYNKETKVIITDGSKTLGALTKVLPKGVVSFILKFF
jgi:hypothetical protein